MVLNIKIHNKQFIFTTTKKRYTDKMANIIKNYFIENVDCLFKEITIDVLKRHTFKYDIIETDNTYNTITLISADSINVIRNEGTTIINLDSIE